jgi:hypothetical protein
MKIAPNAMKAPASTPRTKRASVSRAVLAAPAASQASAISGGSRASMPWLPRPVLSVLTIFAQTSAALRSLIDARKAARVSSVLPLI